MTRPSKSPSKPKWRWSCDSKGRFTALSPDFEKLTGIPARALIGKPIEKFAGDMDGGELARQIFADKLKQRRGFRNFTVTVTRRGKQPRHLTLSGVPRFSPKGRFSGFDGTGATAPKGANSGPTRKQAAKKGAGSATADPHRQISEVLEGLGGGFALWRRDGTLAFCNQAFRTLFQLDDALARPGTPVSEITQAQADRIVSLGLSKEQWIARQIRLRRRPPFEEELQLIDGRWLVSTGRRAANGATTEIITDVTPIKEAELDATRDAQRNAQMAVAISSMDSGVFISNPNLSENPVVFCNPAFQPPEGVDTDDINGMPLAKLIEGMADEQGVATLRTAIAKATPASVVIGRRDKAGRRQWSELRISPVFGAARQVNYFLGIESDITAQKQAELDLEKRMERQAAVAELGRRALEQSDFDALLNDAVKTVSRILGFTYVTIRELIPSTRELILRASTGWPLDQLSPKDTHAELWPEMERVMESERPSWNFRSAEQLKRAPRLLRANGLRFSARTRIAGRDRPFGILAIHDTVERKLDPDDLNFLQYVAYVLGVAVDRRLAETALRESQHRFELAVKGSNDGIWDWDLAEGSLYYSSRWKAMLGFRDDELEDTFEAWLDRVHEEDREEFKTALDEHLNDQTPYFSCEHRLRHKDGGYRWMLVRGLAVRDAQGKATRIAGSLSDITEAKRAEYELMKDALHDSLTGLPNRALFNDRLTQAIVRLNRQPTYLFAVLYLDFDRFKVINDSLGHSYGDQILIEIGHRLKECTREVDTVARLGGDEFAILLDNLEGEERAEGVARRINQMLADPFDLAGRQIVSNASIGIAFSSLGYTSPEEMVRDADIAMYQAKTAGRGRHVVFEKGMHVHAVSQLELETDLRDAIEKDQFTLAYQPVVNIRTGLPAGFEALIRWKHPTRGYVPPVDFMSLAEETKLIIPLGRMVLRMACKQMKRWVDRFPSFDLGMNVNISPAQFGDPNLIDDIENILKETGLKGDLLRLEITEGAIMENPHEVAVRLQQLRVMGVQVYVDDFGTGYSSLSHLQRLPIDALKVDQSFVMSIADSKDNMAIVRAIIDLAHNLNLATVAEGVETKRDLKQLKKLKCDFAQGFFFSTPLDSRKATAYLRDNLAQ